MIAILAAAALAASEPSALQATCSPAPGFAPGQAALADHLAPAQPVELALKPAAGLPFAPPPAKAIAAGSFGAIVPLEIKAAGTYRIALSGRLWIDVVRDGTALPSTAHAHGEGCTGIAKTVAFVLEPGRYAVQLSDAPSRSVTVRVNRVGELPAGK